MIIKRRVIPVILGALALIQVGGCQLWGTTPAVGRPGDFFPITSGSFWDYHGEGNEFASFTREVVATNSNRGQFKENNGGTISASVYEVTDKAVTRIIFQGESYEEINLLNAEPTESNVILQAPLKIGTKWGSPEQPSEIISVDETVETPAGTFLDCIKVQETHPNSIVLEYYKEAVGLVKREFISNGSRVTSTLEGFNIE